MSLTQETRVLLKDQTGNLIIDRDSLIIEVEADQTAILKKQTRIELLNTQINELTEILDADVVTAREEMKAWVRANPASVHDPIDVPVTRKIKDNPQA